MQLFLNFGKTNIPKKLDLSKLKARKEADFKNFFELYKNYFQELANAWHTAFNETEKERLAYPPGNRNRNWHATTMNGHMIGILKRTFPLYMKKYNSRDCFCLGSNYKIFFKKLNAKTKLPSNVPTKRAFQLNTNTTLNDNEDISSILFIGYVLNDDESEIKNIYVVSPSPICNVANWIYDLEQNKIIFSRKQIQFNLVQEVLKERVIPIMKSDTSKLSAEKPSIKVKLKKTKKKDKTS